MLYNGKKRWSIKEGITKEPKSDHSVKVGKMSNSCENFAATGMEMKKVFFCGIEKRDK